MSVLKKNLDKLFLLRTHHIYTTVKTKIQGQWKNIKFNTLSLILNSTEIYNSIPFKRAKHSIIIMFTIK